MTVGVAPRTFIVFFLLHDERVSALDGLISGQKIIIFSPCHLSWTVLFNMSLQSLEDVIEEIEDNEALASNADACNTTQSDKTTAWNCRHVSTEMVRTKKVFLC